MIGQGWIFSSTTTSTSHCLRGIKIDPGYRIDLNVNDLLIVELKCVERIIGVHEAQLLSYLKLSRKSLGLLINFHVRHLRDGIRRFVIGQDWKSVPL
jgi:GxxExxY protein